MRLFRKSESYLSGRPSLALTLGLALIVPSVHPLYAQSAGSLQAQVMSRLQSDSALAGAQITATASGGQVTLNGSVQNEEQWQEAETVAANTPGVRTIQNNLVITGSPDAGARTQMASPAPDSNPTGSPGDTTPIRNGQVPPPPPPDSSNGSSQGYGSYGSGNGSGDSGSGQGYGYGSQSFTSQQESAYGSASQPAPSGPVTVPANTVIEIRTVEPLDTAQMIKGQIFDATAANDVYVGNVLAIPRGAQIQGKVVQLKKAGPLGGNTLIALKLTELNLGGQFYPLDTDLWWNKGPNKAGYTAGNTIAGTAFGAILGGLIGGGTGAAVGAGVGAVGGMGASAATNGPHVVLPSETLLTFHLARPVTVQPVSWQEAQRLAENAPGLRQRPVYRRPYAYPYAYPAPYGYPYPPPYYYGAPSMYLGWGWGW